MPAKITRFPIHQGRPTKHPFGDGCEKRVKDITGRLRRLDGEQLQIVDIIVIAILRGAI
jgi:hypothetical protein